MVVPGQDGGSKPSPFDDYMKSLLPRKPSSEASQTSTPSPKAGPVGAAPAQRPTQQEAFSGRACARCRRYKRRCDNGKPCRYCTSKTMDGSARQECTDCDPFLQGSAKQSFAEALQCQLAMQQKAVERAIQTSVERPLPFRWAKVEISSKAPPMLSALSKREFLARQFGGGDFVPLSKTLSITDAMPDELVDTLVDGMESLRILNADEGVKGPFGFGGGGVQPTSTLKPPTFSLEIIDDGSDALPFFGETYDTNMMRVTDMKMNRRFVRDMLGLSEDEILTRLMTGDVDLPMPELEFLTVILDSFLNCLTHGENRGARNSGYFLFTPGLMKGQKGPLVSKSAVIVREETFQEKDGSKIMEFSRQVAVSAQEYDAARLTNPGRCRPFMAALGDLRTARQLLEDRPTDNTVTFANLQTSERGRRLVTDLTAIVKDRFQPFVAASRDASRVSSPGPSSSFSVGETPSPAPDTSPFPSHASSSWPSPSLPDSPVARHDDEGTAGMVHRAWDRQGAAEPSTSQLPYVCNHSAYAAPADAGQQPAHVYGADQQAAFDVAWSATPQHDVASYAAPQHGGAQAYPHLGTAAPLTPAQWWQESQEQLCFPHSSSQYSSHAADSHAAAMVAGHGAGYAGVVSAGQSSLPSDMSSMPVAAHNGPGWEGGSLSGDAMGVLPQGGDGVPGAAGGDGEFRNDLKEMLGIDPDGLLDVGDLGGANYNAWG